MTRAALAVALSLFLLGVGSRSAAAQILPHDSDWVTFRTSNFDVVFPRELETVARRAAARAEWAHEVLSEELEYAPGGRIQLVLADNLDLSNGFATVFPRNRIVVYTLPPASEPSLAHHDDWLQLLMLHELVHIFHLNQAGGVWQPLRRIFGRDPILFPQIFTPGWLIEGLATYLESVHTTAGRAAGSNFEMIARTAILDDAFFSVDQASLDPVTWPAGGTRYIYGSLFIDYLARRHGPDAVNAFIERIGDQVIPYRPEAAARRAFGNTLRREWVAWQDSLRAEVATLVDSLSAFEITEPELLTTEGRTAHYPRYSPSGETIVYSAATGREDPSHRLLTAEGHLIRELDRTWPGPASWLPSGDGLLFSQLDFDDPYTIRSDLYLGRLQGGSDELTEGSRLWEPDVDPEGEVAVAVEGLEGTNRLAIVDLRTAQIRVLTDADLDVYWSTPRWSPEGQRIAATRWVSGGRFDIVVLDRNGRVIREVTDDPHLDSDPAWSPDGRYLLFSSDRSGIQNLYAYEWEADRLWQVTNVLTGAFQPDVSPDRRWIVFSYYRADGFHIARIPYEPSSWREAPRYEAEAGRGFPGAPPGTSVEGPVDTYSPFPDVLPTYWSPMFAEEDDFGVGVGLSGRDAVERHLWAAQALVFPDGPRYEADLAYRYQGWGRPLLDLEAAQDWTIQQIDGDEEESRLLRREREAATSLSWVGRSWRSSRWVQGGVSLNDVDFFEDDLAPRRSLPLDAGGFIGVGYSSVRGFGLSLGPQAGVMASARIQGRHYLDQPAGEQANRNYWRITGRTRAFHAVDWFGFAPPTFALRLDGGFEGSSAYPNFTLGGSSGQGSGLLVDSWLSRPSSAYPVRGYRSGTQVGDRVLSGSAEYRFPIRLIERGFGLFPLAVDRLWGDIFADIGAAWCPEPCAGSFNPPPTSPDPLLSVGAEAILNLRVGYHADFPLRVGVALPLREPRAYRPSAYLRVGSSF